MKNQNNECLSDYEDFLKDESIPAPAPVTARVLAKIHELANPKAWVIFFKVLSIHLVTGFLSLSVCHQFGMNPFNTQWSLDNWFMSTAGHNICMVGCGIIFVSAGLLVAGLFLNIEEIIVLKRTGILQTFTLGITSLGLFAFFGAELVLSFAALWLLGALIGGLFATFAALELKKSVLFSTEKTFIGE